MLRCIKNDLGNSLTFLSISPSCDCTLSLSSLARYIDSRVSRSCCRCHFQHPQVCMSLANCSMNLRLTSRWRHLVEVTKEHKLNRCWHADRSVQRTGRRSKRDNGTGGCPSGNFSFVPLPKMGQARASGQGQGSWLLACL